MKTGELISKNVAGVNCILPHKHKTAWDLFLKGCANNWMPTEISMADDIKQWKNGDITDDEKLLVKRSLGFFAGSESLVGNNLLLTVARWVTDAECRQYVLRQAYEESLHNWTVVTCCDSYSLKVSEVYEAYNTIPSIKAKDDFLMEITTDVNRQDFSTKTTEGKRHIQFGTYLVNTIKKQYPTVWTKKFEQETIEHIKKAVELEIAYAHDVLPRGILGLNAEMFVDYMQYIGNRRLEGIGIDFRFDSAQNPFPWLSEVVDTGAMTNFFERKVKDYQSSGALEDDF